MKKLVALLQGKLEGKRAENKVKRVEAALNVANLNFKSQKDDNEYKLDDLLEKFNDPDTSVESVIKEISDTIGLVEEAEEGMKRIQKVKDFLFQEVKI